MSQEKVARYKEEKANRKETIKKQKRARLIRNIVTGVVCIALVGWIGYSAVEYYQANRPREVVEADFKAIDDYTASLTAEEIETEDATKEDATKEDATKEDASKEDASKEE